MAQQNGSRYRETPWYNQWKKLRVLKNWNARIVSSSVPMKFCAKLPLFSPKRNSTANRGDGSGSSTRNAKCTVSSLSAASCRLRPSTYYRYKHLKSNPDQRCRRAKRDETLKPQITRVYEDNHKVYGARKVWKTAQARRHSRGTLHCREIDGGSWLRGRTTRQGLSHHYP